MENFIFWAVSEFSLYSKIRQFNEKRKQETTRFREFFFEGLLKDNLVTASWFYG